MPDDQEVVPTWFAFPVMMVLIFIGLPLMAWAGMWVVWSFVRFIEFVFTTLPVPW